MMKMKIDKDEQGSPKKKDELEINVEHLKFDNGVFVNVWIDENKIGTLVISYKMFTSPSVSATTLMGIKNKIVAEAIAAMIASKTNQMVLVNFHSKQEIPLSREIINKVKEELTKQGIIK